MSELAEYNNNDYRESIGMDGNHVLRPPTYVSSTGPRAQLLGSLAVPPLKNTRDQSIRRFHNAAGNSSWTDRQHNESL